MAAGQKFLGHWKLEKNENWDNYMKAVGVGLELRKKDNSLNSYEEWKEEGGQWTLHITSTIKSKLLTFKLGEEFDEETLDGRSVKSTFKVEGDKIVQQQRAVKAGGVNTTITREILPDGRMLMTVVADNKDKVKAMRYFAPHKP
ncbi:sodium/calcium exchanger regulatory protein 1-like [Babylonia areolata]|uniref:sodium/calcium exchanger regulatory protein 1-like n=1 Tax=Babylonia areolata TaxID=304850 RepID=UPI003FD20F02